MAKFEFRTLEEYKATEDYITGALEELTKKLKHEPAQALYDALVPTMKKAVSRAPVEEGHLRQSGKVTVNGVTYARGQNNGGLSVMGTSVPKHSSGEYEFEVGFWADAKDHGAGDVNMYAWVQHEHTEFNHPKGGQAKFLESAIREDQATWAKKMKDAVKEAIDDF